MFRRQKLVELSSCSSQKILSENNFPTKDIQQQLKIKQAKEKRLEQQELQRQLQLQHMAELNCSYRTNGAQKKAFEYQFTALNIPTSTMRGIQPTEMIQFSVTSPRVKCSIRPLPTKLRRIHDMK